MRTPTQSMELLKIICQLEEEVETLRKALAQAVKLGQFRIIDPEPRLRFSRKDAYIAAYATDDYGADDSVDDNPELAAYLKEQP